MKDYKLALFIGRFQPAHNSHILAIKQALQISDKVLIIIGSSHAASNIKNPFTYQQRVDFIRLSLEPDENYRVHFSPVRDYFYNELNWVTEIQNAVSHHCERNDPVILLGHYKDSSSYYLNLFPQWDFQPIQNVEVLNSTNIRKQLFDPEDLEITNTWRNKGQGPGFRGSFDKGLADIMAPDALGWLKSNFIDTEKHYELIREYQFIKNYKKQWEGSPFPPTFVTADAVVVKSGHILLVRRKFEPGKGLYALPGGFIKQSESIESAAVRELKEETRIDVHKNILYSSIKETRTFDHPNRSLRGRTITTAFHIDLGKGELPEVKASDDASGAIWVALSDFYKLEDQMFDDHFHIISYFVSR